MESADRDTSYFFPVTLSIMLAPERNVANRFKMMNIKSPSRYACNVNKKLPAVYSMRNSKRVATFLARKFFTVSGSHATSISNIPINP